MYMKTCALSVRKRACLKGYSMCDGSFFVLGYGFTICWLLIEPQRIGVTDVGATMGT